MAMIRRPVARDEEGFTLLEVMIALAVLAVVLVSVFRMGAQTVSMSANARFDAVAPLLAQEKLAGLVAASPVLPFEDRGDFGDESPGFMWEARIEPVPLEMVEGRQAPLKRIDIRVAMENSGLEFWLRTYRVR